MVRKGISPVIATVIIVAVAIAISLAVASWVLGLWSGFGEYEAVKVLPSSYMNTTHIVLDLYNPGPKPAIIQSIEVNSSMITVSEVVEPGEYKTIVESLPFTPQTGVSYTVKVYTMGGNVYTTILTVRG